LKATEFGEIT